MRVAMPLGLLLIPYIPVGLVIMVLRLFVYLHALLASYLLVSCGSLKRFVLRAMCLVLGIIVQFSVRKKPEDRLSNLPIVANHITLVDHLILCLYRDGVTSHSNVFHWFASFVQDAKSGISTHTLQKTSPSTHYFPEKSPSDSTDHLLVFDHTLLDHLDMVQPVAISARRIFPVKLVSYPIVWYTELLWHFFVPFTCYRIDYLEPMRRLSDETTVDFTERIRTRIAKALNVQLGDMTGEQLAQGGASSSLSIKSATTPPSDMSSTTTISPASSVSLDLSSRRSSASQASGLRYRGPRGDGGAESSSAGTFDHLIPVVQEVMAHASVKQIKRALAASDGDVESAIEALLSANDESSTDSPPQPDSTTMVPVSRLNMAAKHFPNTSSDRQQSLQERRQLLLNHARKRFLSNVPHTG